MYRKFFIATEKINVLFSLPFRSVVFLFWGQYMYTSLIKFCTLAGNQGPVVQN